MEIKPTQEDYDAVKAKHTGSLDDDAVAAHQYRLAQAHAMLRMFREANGRDAVTSEELGNWLNDQ